MAYDVIVKDGLIVDGTGAPAYRGDVAIKDGRFVQVGHERDIVPLAGRSATMCEPHCVQK